ncbi:CDP-glucose 4,6-dehydratase [bacterium]|nr:CDP-glucose 4,6-dehydratase [bacterium]
MENLEINLFGNVFKNKRVLVTGHTGFKGSWLALWLSELGAKVGGLSLDPCTTPNHWDLLGLSVDDHRGDIRDVEKTTDFVKNFSPEIVFHLAAQPLVRRSYRDPLETFSTNIMGTANVLEACRHVNSVQSIVCITTDKVYANKEWTWGYRENDILGGHDPYSASKAACEIVLDSYRKAFFEEENRCLLATVRAGNVIGGGDWSEDRLIPDLVRATTTNSELEIRSPNATRPWQHVLESLCGYLMVGQRLIERKAEFAQAWNFGPNAEDNRRVIEILDELKLYWPKLAFGVTADPQPHEANLLYLDNSMAKSKLNWQPVWTLQKCLLQTAQWYQSQASDGNISSREQLHQFIDDARRLDRAWAQ